MLARSRVPQQDAACGRSSPAISAWRPRGISVGLAQSAEPRAWRFRDARTALSSGVSNGAAGSAKRLLQQCRSRIRSASIPDPWPGRVSLRERTPASTAITALMNTRRTTAQACFIPAAHARYSRRSWFSVGVPGDELRDAERQRDLEDGEEREAHDDQQDCMPRHSLSGLAFGRETGFLGPLLGPVKQAVMRLRSMAFRVAQRCARCHACLVPVQPQP